jgi:sterol desaturase/sphingolipid hydroxylase (fatty acid hydroxylase superfamily)
MTAHILESLRISIQLFTASAVAYVFLALVVKGRAAIRGARDAVAETRLNVAWYFLDALFIAPVVGLVVAGLRLFVDRYSLSVLDAATWQTLGTLPTVVLAVFFGDLVSYWRHRLEHTPWLWPAHAIHHSDTQMTWLTLARFHPVNRLVTASIDLGVLALLGFPVWAIITNEIVRHHYGEFIHADFNWTFGPLGYVFVSPTMHQWHHARDVVGSGSNFATVFAIFDYAFGTYDVPGVCNVALGVTDGVGSSIARQLLHPFICWIMYSRKPTAAAHSETIQV